MDKVQSQSHNLGVKRVLCYIVLVLLTIISLFPFYIMIVNCTRSHMQIQSGFSALPGASFIKNFVNLAINKKTESTFWQGVLEKYGVALSSKTGNYAENYPILRGMLNSLFIAISVAAITTYFSSMSSYGIYMYNFKGKKFAFRFIMAVMMIPAQVTMIGFYQMVYKIHMTNNLLMLILPAIASPSMVFFMRQYLQSTLSMEIVQSARIDGAGEYLIFNSIVLPIMKPAIATQAIFSFVSSWNNLFTPLVLLTDQDKYTMPIMVSLLRGDIYKTEYGSVYLGLTLTVLPLIIVYLLLSKYIIAGVALGSVKG